MMGVKRGEAGELGGREAREEGTLWAASSSYWCLRPFSSESVRTEVVVNREAPGEYQMVGRGVPDGLAITQCLFPIISYKRFASCQDRGCALERGKIGRTIYTYAFTYSFLLFPLVSSILKAEVSLTCVYARGEGAAVGGSVSVEFATVSAST